MTRPNPGKMPAGKSTGSAEKTLRLLLMLADKGHAMTLAELSESLGIPKATTHRLCARLLDLRFIAKDVDERYFAIGPVLRKLAFDVLTHGSLSGLRHKVLSALVDEIGETCNFTTRDGVEVLYLDRVEALRPWRLTLSVGVHVPLHCTASGKLFLSKMPPDERNMLMNQLPLDPLTPNSATSVDQLMKEVDATIERGYGFDCEEFVIGLIAVAVPVADSTGKVRAAVAMHCPTSHVSAEESLTRIPALKKAAAKMGELL